MRSNLDVWAIQNYKYETRNALKNVKKDSYGNILYVNCISTFKIGNRYFNRTYDMCFYSEESDTVIFFARGMISEKEVIGFLEEMDIQFSINRFCELNDEYENDDKVPEVWFARETYVLEDAIDDSLNRDNHKCTYYPELVAELSLGYKADCSIVYDVEGRACKGVLLFEDKIVLLINQDDKRNLKEKEVMKILKEKGITCEVVRKPNKR